MIPAAPTQALDFIGRLTAPDVQVDLLADHAA